MSALHSERGASLRIGILGEPEVADFIDTHADILDSSFEKARMSDAMRERLKRSDWIFSGMKTFHELNEAFPSLLDENGDRKPFNRFLNDVRKVDETYNRNYLNAEYNFAQASAEMAGRWEDFDDGGRHLLQYRTAGDDKVRPEHAELHGVTLPKSDRFWDEYFPPNGWNCRCTVVEVLRSSNVPTERGEAFRRAKNALSADRKGMFRFNPGKEGKSFPDYNPYTRSGCRGCTRKLSLAKGIPDNQLCDACDFVRAQARTGDIAGALKNLKTKKGTAYVEGLREIISMRIFKPLRGENGIFHAGGESNKDFHNLKAGAVKAVSHGFTVHILPNPGDTKSGDYILSRKGFVGLYDLKTITGKNSVSNRLAESEGQANRVVLNVTSQYNPRKMAGEIREYFRQNKDALEVIVFKGRKMIDVNRDLMTKGFDRTFSRLYKK